MKKFWINLLLATVVAAFLVLWLLPLGVLLFRPPIYATVPLVALFGVVTWRLWRAWRAIPDALQPKTPPGVQLRESDAPGLFALAARVKAYAGTNSVVECWCDISGIISAVAYAEHVAAEAKVALRNGIAALAVMTQSEIETLLRYHLAILTFSPRLMSWALKGRMVSGGFFYFAPYVVMFNVGLRKIERYARAQAANIDETSAVIDLSREVAMQFQVFWLTGMQPFLQTGHFMPVAEGFAQFWGASHPAKEGQLALGMLDSFSRIETRLTSDLLKANPGIERASWEQARLILLVSWKQTVAENASVLQGVTAGEICDGREKTPILWMALAAALDKAGWRFAYSGPGTRVAFVKGDHTVEPFQVDCEKWAEQCEQIGIARLPLA